MQGRSWILVAVAIVIGAIAVLIANSYFSGVERSQERAAEEQRLARIVVANQDMAFGTPLGVQNLRLANWPANSVPVGAYTTIEQATQGGRVATRPMVIGEPVLASKVSGADGRATLATNLPRGKLAYAIPINDVSGVGGFVRPGDLVDVLLTRQIPGDGAGGNDKMTDVVLEAVRVLGLDQNADDKDNKPAVAKTATLEVDTFSAQKLALATQLGSLSLALRNVADPTVGPRQTVVPRHLSATNFYMRAPSAAAPAAPARASVPVIPIPASLTPRRTGPSMTIVRGSQISEYEVQRGW